MKKHLVITAVLFISITVLCLATNFIRWDETPLEQSILAMPLALGLVLEAPFLGLMGLWVRDTTEYINYELFGTIIPFVTGAFYAGLYYFLASMTKKLLKKPGKYEI